MYKRIVNKLLKQFEKKRIHTDQKVIYLTFDDGPEPGITEFVLYELDKYNFKATFFCRGDHAEKNSELMDMIIGKGHVLANHTYSHLNAYDVPSTTYVENVDRANTILHTDLFRPPHGSLTFSTWLRLRKRYKIVYWSLNSEDSSLQKFKLKYALDNLKINTKAGDVVLFHFCHRHENETQKILPLYLAWLHEQKYDCKTLK